MIVDYLNKGIRLALCLTAAAYIGLITSTSQAAVLSKNFSYNDTTKVLTDGNANGLSWLNLNQTRGRSYTDISSKLGVGQEFDGYRYATGLEVAALVGHWVGYAGPYTNGITLQPEGNFDDLISFIGDTSVHGSAYSYGNFTPNPLVIQHWALGMTADFQVSSDFDILYLARLYDYDESLANDDYLNTKDGGQQDFLHFPTIGSYLVKSPTISAVPLPASLPLYGAGVAVMGFIGWRSKRRVVRT